MKAIVNVNKNSAYKQLNGLTFDVKELLSKVVALDVLGLTIDFSYNEIFIVDLKEEFKVAVENASRSRKKRKDLASLVWYINTKKYEKILNNPFYEEYLKNNAQ